MAKLSKKDLILKYQKKIQSKGTSNLFKLPADAEFFKEDEGTVVIDILPYKVTDPNNSAEVPVGDEWFVRTFNVHYGVGPENKQVICPTSVGKRCPICEEYFKIVSDPETKEEARALRAKERQIFNVVDVEKNPKKILLWNISTFLFGESLFDELNDSEDESVWGFYEPKGGYSLRCRFKKESAGGYTMKKVKKIDFRKRVKDGKAYSYPVTISDKTYNLDEVLNILSYEEIDEMFRTGEVSESTETTAEVDAPVEENLFQEDDAVETTIEEKDPEERKEKKSEKAPEEEPEEDFNFFEND